MINLHKYYFKDYFLDESILDNRKTSQSFIKIDFSYLLYDPEDETVKTKQIDNEYIISKRNRIFIGHHLNIGKFEDLTIANPACCPDQNIELEVAYPGLVTGIGLDHEVGIKGEFKLGVHFDYTRGVPVVYGSSVKGVLRAYFNDFYVGKFDVKDLFQDIFEGKQRDTLLDTPYVDGQDRKYVDKSIYDRDVFFDAIIVNTKDIKKRILCSDSITVHSDPLQNPTPITFLKIAPGCTLQFRFKLVNSKLANGEIYSISEKMKLFKLILTMVGIGAKTNVGYGQFV